MKTPKPGTPKRPKKLSLSGVEWDGIKCHVVPAGSYVSYRKYNESLLKFDELKVAYAKQSETLNDLSLSYNQLVEEHSKLKENFSFIGNQSTKYFKEKQELTSELEQVKSDYLKATNAFVEERKQHKKDFKAVVIWAVINMAFAVSEICYILYLLIK